MPNSVVLSISFLRSKAMHCPMGAGCKSKQHQDGAAEECRRAFSQVPGSDEDVLKQLAGISQQTAASAAAQEWVGPTSGEVALPKLRILLILVISMS